MLRIIAFVLAVAAIAVVAISFHQPPMRLMPVPEVFLDGRAGALAIDPAQALDPNIQLFYATNRVAFGPVHQRTYAVMPGNELHLGVSSLRIGGAGIGLNQIYEWSTRASGEERPFIHLVNLNETASFGGGAPTSDVLAWLAQVDSAVKASRSADILIYVHGANTTFERAAGQAAQLHHFAGRQAVIVLFAWPTAENFLLYSRDMVTAQGAAPHLADLIRLLDAHTSAAHVGVFTYSAGGAVGSRGLALAVAGDAKPALGEVYHAAPDADFRSFVAELKDYARSARRVAVAANLNDSALRLSQVVNRASRAGRPDIAELSEESTAWLLDAVTGQGLELLRVRPENIPGLSRTSHTFWYDDPWISSDVLATLFLHLPPSDRALAEEATPAGAVYWTFPPDYPQRLVEAIARARNAAGATP